MDFLYTLPASIKVLGAFCGAMILSRVGLPLGIALLINALLLTFAGGSGQSGFLFLLEKMRSPETILLLVAIMQLLFFTEALTRTGRIERTVKALSNLLRRPGLLLAGFPALIGLLPMPGGALFSAPLVASVDTQSTIEPVRKTAINYWFRHIWEFWWPLYPGVVMAIRYSGLPLWTFYIVMMPLTLASITAGYFFILRNRPTTTLQKNNEPALAGDAAAALVPIFLLLVIAVGGSTVLTSRGFSPTLANLAAMCGGLVLASSLAFWKKPRTILPALKALTSKQSSLLAMLIVGVQVFSIVLKIPLDESSATLVTQMRSEFMLLGIPLIPVIMLITFISGLVTGIAFGFVGASFPLVFALIGPDPTYGTQVATTVLAYGFGYVGMMASPLHTCFVLTAHYFKSELFKTYRYIALPLLCIALAVMALAGCYYYFL